MNQRQVDRRRFLARGAGGAASVLILRSSRTAFGYTANERLNLAVVGVAGYVAGTAFCRRYTGSRTSELPPCATSTRGSSPPRWSYNSLWSQSPFSSTPPCAPFRPYSFMSNG